jgi:hypothetical protein
MRASAATCLGGQGGVGQRSMLCLSPHGIDPQHKSLPETISRLAQIWPSYGTGGGDSINRIIADHFINVSRQVEQS